MPLSDLGKCHSSVIFCRLDLRASRQLNRNWTRGPLPQSHPWAIYCVYRQLIWRTKNSPRNRKREWKQTSLHSVLKCPFHLSLLLKSASWLLWVSKTFHSEIWHFPFHLSHSQFSSQTIYINGGNTFSVVIQLTWQVAGEIVKTHPWWVITTQWSNLS